MAQKPSIPKGTRDFGPIEMAKRNYIFDTIRQVYALYGFQQIETPAMETLQTLMGKYGEEGDKLLFKVLNSGDYLGKITDEFTAGNQTFWQADIFLLFCHMSAPILQFPVPYNMHRIHRALYPYRKGSDPPVSFLPALAIQHRLPDHSREYRPRHLDGRNQ